MKYIYIYIFSFTRNLIKNNHIYIYTYIHVCILLFTQFNINIHIYIYNYISESKYVCIDINHFIHAYIHRHRVYITLFITNIYIYIHYVAMNILRLVWDLKLVLKAKFRCSDFCFAHSIILQARILVCDFISDQCEGNGVGQWNVARCEDRQQQHTSKNIKKNTSKKTSKNIKQHQKTDWCVCRDLGWD